MQSVMITKIVEVVDNNRYVSHLDKKTGSSSSNRKINKKKNQTAK